MGILSEIKTLLNGLSIPCETGRMSSPAPDEYCVLVPLGEESLWGDDTIDTDVEECIISVFTKGNYINLKKMIIRALLSNVFAVTGRGYIGYEDDTGYFHYEITVEHPYPYNEENESKE